MFINARIKDKIANIFHYIIFHEELSLFGELQLTEN